jgi:hypothetical protein
MVGSVLAGAIPVLGRESIHLEFGEIPHHLVVAGLGPTISLYRIAVFIGLAGWFLSLVPALMLREIRKEEHGNPGPARPWWRLGNVKHKGRILKLVTADAFLDIGAGLTIPLLSVFFLRAVRANELEIGIVFAIGAAALSGATFLAPYVSERMGKVRSVATFRFTSIPFILGIGLAPILASQTQLSTIGFVNAALLIAAVSYMLRSVLMNMTSPLYDAFTMEMLDPGERATATGIVAMDNSILNAVGVFIGASLMGSGDFLTPFLAMAGFYSVSTLLFYAFFRRTETELSGPATTP